MKVLWYLIVACAAFLFASSCNKSSLVGSDLFVPGSIDVFYEDDFDIIANTIRVDSAVTYDGLNSLSTLIIGELRDPIFGYSKAEAFIDLNRSSTVTPPFVYTLNGLPTISTLDSVVLTLAYNQEGFYGDSTAMHDVEVRIIESTPFEGDTLYSTFKPAGEGELIGSTTIVPSYYDSIFVTEPNDSSATGYANQVRIKLDNSWAQQMFLDTTLISSATNFKEFAPGLQIISTTNGSSTWGIDLGNTITDPANTIRIYYTQDDEQLSYDIIVNGSRHNYYEHDYSGAAIEEFFGSEEKGDSLLFLQGMAGTEVEFDLPVLESGAFEEFLINQAELEFFVYEDENFDIYDAIESIAMQRYNENGELVTIEDAFIATEILVDGTFDGFLDTETVDGMELKMYSAIITIHATERFNESMPSIKLRLLPRNKSIIPNRSILYGPGHSKYPMKFKLNYSK